MWRVEDQLGPHTGWVKDMASCSRTANLQAGPSNVDNGAFIFSIGCNCIEVWSAVDGAYQHVQKLQIESSVEMGSTLSSDLLCLATYSEFDADGANTNYLVAGGVDGRIHRWKIQADEILESRVISAHDGRVNALAVCNNINVLVSVGNDGCINCWSMDKPNPSEWKVSSLDICRHGRESSSATKKITSLCIVREEENRSVIAVGTSFGKISLAEIIKSEGNSLQVSFLKDRAVARSIEEEANVIHALCSKKYEKFCRLIIAHSSGLSVWKLSNDDA